jgi:predicted ATPase/DNA-binding SARP family transcriptional activator
MVQPIPDPQMAELRLSLLGRFGLQQDSQSVALRTRKAESLLAYLVLYPARHTREELAALFWGDTPEPQARASLRAALADLRRALGPDIILSDRMFVEYNPGSGLRVDALEFRAQAAAFIGEDRADPAAFDPGLYAGELLSGHYDDWVLAERERLRQLYLEALLHRVRRLRALACYDEAIAGARQALEVEPAEERVHQQLIALYSLTGNRPAAMRQLELCRRTLKEELDVEPAPETLALAETIAGSPVKPGPAANLPVPLTSFIGRERELAALSGLLQDGRTAGGCRLLTLTGAGGSGKTRLAIQVCRSMLPHYRDGVWWADLSALQDPALLPETVLAALSIAPGQPSLQALTGYLRERSLLLALDNCEHVAQACAQLATAVLQSCPHVQVLATSREPLGVPGEQLWPVPTFSVPGEGAGPEVEGLLAYDAVRLFVQRARMHRPSFELTSDNAAQVAEICRRLDGIPLAIELAAARVRSMNLDDILARLGSRLRLLASAGALTPPRQQTMRASIDWSYNQLTPPEGLLLQRLAVFVGGCTLAAAESVCAGGELGEDQVLDLLGRLVDRSLVVAEGGRYRLLETIREYALERLADAREADALRDRHSEQYLTLIREQESRLCSHDQRQALADLASEVSNIRLALEWAIDTHQVARLRQISFPLLYLYEIRGWLREGEAIFQDAAGKLSALEESDPLLEREREIAMLDMETNAAYFSHRLGRPAEAYSRHRACVEGLRDIGGKRVLRYALRYCGIGAMALRNFDQAEALLHESRVLSEDAGRVWDIGIDHAYLGYVAQGRGAAEQAQGYFGRALQISRQLGDPRLLAYSLNGLGQVLLALGQPMQARALAEEALRAGQETGDGYDLANTWALLGQVASRLGEPVRARTCFERSAALLTEMGGTPGLISVYVRLGHLALAAGELAEAEGHFRTAASIATQYQVEGLTMDALAGLASLRARRGAAGYALELLQFVLCHPASSAAAKELAERLRPEVQARLAPDQVQDIERRGCSEAFEASVRKLLAGECPPEQ